MKVKGVSPQEKIKDLAKIIETEALEGNDQLPMSRATALIVIAYDLARVADALEAVALGMGGKAESEMRLYRSSERLR